MPLPARGRDLDAAADRGDLVAHHVHADAAAGELRSPSRGREARLEQTFDQLLLARLGVASTRPTPMSGAFCAARSKFDAGAVVGELERDFVAFLPQREVDRAGLGLARLARARSGVSRPCAERVAQHVLERRADASRARERSSSTSRRRSRAPPSCRARAPSAARCGTGARSGLQNGTARMRISSLLHVAVDARLREQRGVGVADVLAAATAGSSTRR